VAGFEVATEDGLGDWPSIPSRGRICCMQSKTGNKITLLLFYVVFLLTIVLCDYQIKYTSWFAPHYRYEKYILFGYIFLCCISLLLQWVRHKIPLAAIGSVATALLFLPTLFYPEARDSLIWLLLIVLAIFSVGFLISDLLKIHYDAVAESFAFQCFMGFSFYGMLGLALLFLNVFQLNVILFALITPIVIFVFKTTLKGRPYSFLEKNQIFTTTIMQKMTSRLEVYCLWATFCALVSAYIWTIAPSVFHDSIGVNLVVPNIYIANGGMVEVPHIMQSYLHGYSFVYFGYGLLLYQEPLPALLHYLSLLISLGLIFFSVRRFINKTVAWIAMTAFALCPVVMWEAGVTYPDLFVSLFVFGMYYCLGRWWQERLMKWIVLAGLSGGMAAGTKIFAGFFVFYFIVSLIIVALGGLKEKRIKLTPLVLGVSASLPVLPYLIRNYLWTMNPVFPLLNGFFKSPKWAQTNELFNLSMFGVKKDLGSFLLFPWYLSFNTYQFGELAAGSFLSLPILSFFCLPLILHRDKSYTYKYVFFILYLIFCLSIFFVFAQYYRYMLSMIPVMGILTGMSMQVLWDRGVLVIKHLPVLYFAANLIGGIALISGLLFYGVMHFHLPERFPLMVFLGKENQEQFMNRTLRPYQALHFLKQQSTREKLRVISFSYGFSFYAGRALHFEDISYSPNVQSIVRQTTPKRLAQSIHQGGFNRVLIDWNWVHDRKMEAEIFVSQSFLDQFTKLIFSTSNVSVYEMLSPDKWQLPSKKERIYQN
jgi:4-amino-4-deoxy-L-arabinose transferase-like glycosyltransferase